MWKWIERASLWIWWLVRRRGLLGLVEWRKVEDGSVGLCGRCW